MHDSRRDQGLCHTTYCKEEHSKRNVGDPDHLILGLFRIAEDVIRKSAAVISNVEWRGYISIPSQVARNLRPSYFYGVYTGSRFYGQDCSECSLRGLGDVCPKHFGQSDSPQLGRDAGSSLMGRDQEVDQGGE